MDVVVMNKIANVADGPIRARGRDAVSRPIMKKLLM